jgi:hypothetical protein
MARGAEIQRIFEVADDAMQGVVGYWLYSRACYESSNAEEISERLPETLPITPDWVRYYDKADLVREIGGLFCPYLVRAWR